MRDCPDFHIPAFEAIDSPQASAFEAIQGLRTIFE